MYEKKLSEFKLWNGKKLKFWWRDDTNDIDVINGLVEHDEYALREYDFKQGDTVLDIGAHIGTETVYLASLPQKLNIYAFEPEPENCKMIRENLKINGLNRRGVHVIQKAVMGKNGICEFSYGDPNTESGKRHRFILGDPFNVPQDRKNRLKTKCITLEQIFKDYNLKRVKLIKIDSEKWEKDTFQATPKKILDKIDCIIGEHHGLTRTELFDLTKGVFNDVWCDYLGGPTDCIGHFKFKHV